MSWIEKEEAYLEKALDEGEISLEEFNKQLRSLYREASAHAEEAAQEAYNNELGRWY